MPGKLIIFSAPSGAGKSTLVHYLLSFHNDIEFSVSATSRKPRGTEQNGVDYYFLTPDEFRNKIANNEFLEYEEVYPDYFYGTLRSEVERITSSGKNVIFDVDVVGGSNIKKQYKEDALAIFIAPPGIDELKKRLEARCTDSPEMIAERISKAEYEMGFSSRFDVVIVNDDLEKAKQEVKTTIGRWLNNVQNQ